MFSSFGKQKSFGFTYILPIDKALIEVTSEYLDYTDVFSFDFSIELPKNTSMNKHAIKLIEGKQPPYGLIYYFKPVELKILKTYIETYLKTEFIWALKFPAGTPIFFNQKLDRSFRFCVNYQGLNNLTIKHWYPSPLIGKALVRLS